MSKSLYVEDLSIQIDGRIIVDGIHFDVESGEIACLVGPSGCGKTSILRSIVGFQSLYNGSIKLDSKTLSSSQINVPIEQRKVGMVVQDFSLFPHLNVKENICFGLGKQSASSKEKRLESLLKLTGLEKHKTRYPHELSGGQQQRVALARAIAPKPDLLLLDEPFSSLDTSLRQDLASNLRNVLKTEKITALMVTHDQQEAFTIADKIGVLNDGQLEQWDAPYQIYHQPKTRFVANFIGEGQFIKGQVKDDNNIETVLGLIKSNGKQADSAQQVDVLIRPDDIVHDDDSSLKAKVIEKRFLGAEFLYKLELDNKEVIMCYAYSHHDHQIGEAIGIEVDLEHCVYF